MTLDQVGLALALVGETLEMVGLALALVFHLSIAAPRRLWG